MYFHVRVLQEGTPISTLGVKHGTSLTLAAKRAFHRAITHVTDASSLAYL